MEFLNAFSHMDWSQVLHLTLQHITLVGIAVILAILIGVPLGVLMTRFPSLAGPLQASATVLLSIATWKGVREGSLLVLPGPPRVRVVRIAQLPARRGPPSEAAACYVDMGASDG